jgi:hypothetical protein
MNRYTTSPLEVHETGEGISEFDRADLIFYGVDHSGPSYEGRVFLNNAEATIETPTAADAGYAGSFYVFGHGGCVGEEGHCEPEDRVEDEFDRRAPHPIRPWTKTVTVTEALQRAAAAEVTVTVVAVLTGGESAKETDALQFDHVRLATYIYDDD